MFQTAETGDCNPIDNKEATKQEKEKEENTMEKESNNSTEVPVDNDELKKKPLLTP